MVFGLYGLAFIGGWMEQIGTFANNTTARYIGIAASLLVPSESLWQLAAHHMQPPIMRDLALTPFSPASVASPAMVAWAVLLRRRDARRRAPRVPDARPLSRARTALASRSRRARLR